MRTDAVRHLEIRHTLYLLLNSLLRSSSLNHLFQDTCGRAIFRGRLSIGILTDEPRLLQKGYSGSLGDSRDELLRNSLEQR